MSNTAFSGLGGCCSSTTYGFESVCYDAAQVTAVPTLTLGNTAFSLFCTYPTRPSRAMYTWPGADLTDYVDDDAMSMHSSSYDASTSVPKPNHQATPTRSMTVATATAQQTTSNSGSSGSSTSAVTIAGGIAGGVAGASIIGAGVISLLLKRKSYQQDGLDEPGNLRYESVPKDQSDHVGKGM
ncbi:unnamed protein product [Penicillium discolor]